jgi:hypothetical protein
MYESTFRLKMFWTNFIIELWTEVDPKTAEKFLIREYKTQKNINL